MASLQQKHHFIPRFILRRFAPKEQPPAGPASSRRKTRRDFLVNKVDLEKCMLTQRAVSTEFALVDMYRDPGFDKNPYHLEEKLSQLEGQASIIIERAHTSFANNSVLELKRAEVDNLRKFLFLMKYRNSSMFDRYNHDSIEDYDSDDRARMERYMKAKGFHQPREVWFDNLRQLLDLRMDPEKSWTKTLAGEMYPDDAKMFELHLLHSYLTFCSPEAPEEEFLLTQNAYGVFEGPSTVRLNTATRKMEALVYNEHHNFAPLSPRLIIVLRSHLVSPPIQDSRFEAAWEQIGRTLRSYHLHPDRAGSMLQDLPVSPCKTVRVSPTPTSSKDFHANDRFQFQCFKLSSAHVAIINNLFLEEGYITSSIVYYSPNSLRASIEKYFEDESEGMKTVFEKDPLDKRGLYLASLARILHDLGGSTKCKTIPFGLSPGRVHMSFSVAWEVAIQLLQREEGEGSLPRIYFSLKPGSTERCFWNDIYQASLMMQLRTKIDRALKTARLNHEDKVCVRLNRQAFFCTFPPERLWIYLKISRNMNRFHPDDFTVQIADLSLDGAEDKYAKLIPSYPSRRDVLVALMYREGMT
ncbi:hypothetical protein MW887_011503 [Aspergillus wentii]|nr:hypothetical protein MW887_011503 [Aspergillus wentii]